VSSCPSRQRKQPPAIAQGSFAPSAARVGRECIASPRDALACPLLHAAAARDGTRQRNPREAGAPTKRKRRQGRERKDDEQPTRQQKEEGAMDLLHEDAGMGTARFLVRWAELSRG
jgi:hypothetical protein